MLEHPLLNHKEDTGMLAEVKPFRLVHYYLQHCAKHSAIFQSFRENFYTFNILNCIVMLSEAFDISKGKKNSSFTKSHIIGSCTDLHFITSLISESNCSVKQPVWDFQVLFYKLDSWVSCFFFCK